MKKEKYSVIRGPPCNLGRYINKVKNARRKAMKTKMILKKGIVFLFAMLLKIKRLHRFIMKTMDALLRCPAQKKN